MATPNQQTQTGNRVQLEFDGKRVGLIQSCRGSDDYGLEAASGIGDAHAQEYVPGMARHTVSISGMTLGRGNLRQQGIIAENVDIVLKGMVFDINIYSKDTNRLLRGWRKCSYASGDLEVGKHSIIMQSGTFMALDVFGMDL